MNNSIKHFAFLYADGLVLFAESFEALLSQLNTFSEYCILWKLIMVNSSQTKMLAIPIRTRVKLQFILTLLHFRLSWSHPYQS